MKQIIPTITKRTGLLWYASLGTAGVLTLIALLQLFTYEDMPLLLARLLPESLESVAPTIMALLMIGHVLSIPYFLPLVLSPLARALSATLAVVVPFIWLALNIMSSLSETDAANGYFGSKLDHHAGTITILLIGAVIFMCVYVIVKSKDVRLFAPLEKKPSK